ncbi:hypothetical protein A4X03_0g9463 [Tilletia caries]|uniref:Uncharacterized protein n=1 Tax=Tilletia caries TaxID=13290 RepID=A0A8T8SB28_9BASI|nr:hypothetical protein A4X03_0g9463 [Tilletia caries]
MSTDRNPALLARKEIDIGRRDELRLLTVWPRETLVDLEGVTTDPASTANRGDRKVLSVDEIAAQAKARRERRQDVKVLGEGDVGGRAVRILSVEENRNGDPSERHHVSESVYSHGCSRRDAAQSSEQTRIDH